MEKNNYISGIDGLRAIAVLSVLFFHAGFDGMFSGGFVGVDIFFVISGFLITRLIVKEVTREGRFSFSNFYYRRCKRLFPALFFVFILTFIFAFLLFTPQHFERFGGELIYSIMSVSNFYFWSEAGYFDTDSFFKPLLHTWSLSVEEQFYLFWPIVLVFLLNKVPKYIIWIFIALSIVVSLALNIVMSDGHSNILTNFSPGLAAWFEDGPATIFYLAPFRVFEFAIGASLVWVLQYTPKKNSILEILMLAGLIFIAYSILVFDKNTVFPSYSALVPCVGAFLVIFSVNAKYLGVVVRNKLFVGIGLISYSLYLIHWPILVFYKYYYVFPLSLKEKCAIILVSILAAVLMYFFIEQPFRKHDPDNAGNSRAGFGLASAIMSMLLLLPSATVWGGSGWKWRSGELPEEIAAQLENSKQFHVDNYGGAGFPSVGWIVRNDADEADIVLLGDSHARHYAYGFKEVLGRAEHKSIYVSSTSCLLLPDIARTTPGNDWEKLCADRVNTALDVLKKKPDAVLVIAHLWGYQISVAKDTEIGLPIKSYQQILPKLDELKKLIGNHRLIIIGNVPGAGSNDVIGCFARPTYIPFDCDKFLSRSENEISTISDNKVLKEYASNTDGVEFIDVHEAFCIDGLCRSFSQGHVIYSDEYHLSKHGSLEFAKYFKKKILGIMPGSL
jgi:peptidoglycan/LPS O-acetylase OafA/YrhL